MAILSEIQAFLFDMDGVIIDSNPLHRVAWDEYNLRYGIQTTEEMHAAMYGKRNDQIVRVYFGAGLTDAEVDAHGEAKEALYRELMADRLEESLVPGVRQFVAGLGSTPRAVATNANQANLDFVLDRSGLRQYFPVAVHGGQVENPKPAPDVYLRAAELIGVAPRHCVVFEDSKGGAAAGVAAGMRVVGISTTFAHLPGTELMVRSFSDPALREWLAANRG